MEVVTNSKTLIQTLVNLLLLGKLSFCSFYWSFLSLTVRCSKHLTTVGYKVLDSKCG